MLKKNDNLGEAVLAKKSGAAKNLSVLPPATIKKPELRELPRVEQTAAAVPNRTAARTGGSYAAEESAAPSVSYGGPDVTPDLGREIAFEAPAEDAEARARYESALASLDELRGAAPQYDSRYDAQIRELYEQLTGRAAFRYDAHTDPLYQQYAQSYIRQGKAAMRDATGRAAALTGGYGSSYAQAVGQQRYDAYLQRLADVLPETYGMALDAYKAEGEELRRRLETTEALEKSDYARYLDALGQHNRELDRAQDAADLAYERMISGDERAYGRAVDDYGRRVSAEERAYGRKQDYYDRLVDLIAAGYTPSAQDYALAGMSTAQGEALRAQYLAAAGRSSGGGRSRRKKETDTKQSASSSAPLLNKTATAKKTPNRR